MAAYYRGIINILISFLTHFITSLAFYKVVKLAIAFSQSADNFIWYCCILLLFLCNFSFYVLAGRYFIRPLRTRFTTFCSVWLLSIVLILINVIGFAKNGLFVWGDYSFLMNPIEALFAAFFGDIIQLFNSPESTELIILFIPPLLTSTGLWVGLQIKIRKNRINMSGDAHGRQTVTKR